MTGGWTCAGKRSKSTMDHRDNMGLSARVHLLWVARESISSRKMMAPPSCSAALKISARLRSDSPYHLLATASSGTYIRGTAAWLAITLHNTAACDAHIIGLGQASLKLPIPLAAPQPPVAHISAAPPPGVQSPCEQERVNYWCCLACTMNMLKHVKSSSACTCGSANGLHPSQATGTGSQEHCLTCELLRRLRL